MTEIIDDALWLCSLGELRLEINRAQPHAIINLTLPDDYRTWESTHEDLVDFYVRYPFADGPLPDLSELDRLADMGTQLIREQKRLIVHCAAGHNRSGLLAALIVRQLHGFTGSDAMEFVRAKRSCVLWNRKYSEFLAGLGRPQAHYREQAAAD